MSTQLEHLEHSVSTEPNIAPAEVIDLMPRIAERPKRAARDTVFAVLLLSFVALFFVLI